MGVDLLAREQTLLPDGNTYLPWRDIEAFLTIKDKQARVVRFKLNRMQRADAEVATHRDLRLKSRQIGMTSWRCADYVMRTVLRGNISYALVLDEDSKAEAWREIIDGWVKVDLRRWGIAPRIGKDNRLGMTFPGIGSEIHVFSAGKRAPGRSSAFNILHLSETAHYEDAGKAITALEPSVPPPPYGIVFEESTPNGVGDVFYNDWQAAKAARWDRRSAVSLYEPGFYAWWWGEEYRIKAPRWFQGEGVLREEERLLREGEGLDWDQLWWRRTTKERMERAGESFLQEYPEDDESCFIGSGSKVFDREGMRYLHTLVRPPFRVLWENKLQVWEEPQVGHQYVIGCDTAEGVENDYHAAVVVDREGNHHVATLRARGGVTPSQFAVLLDDLGRMYRWRGSQAYLGVERRSSGYTVLAELEGMGYDNLHTEVVRVEQRRPVYEAGVMMSGATKRPMVNELQEAVRTARLVTHDEALVGELVNYEQRREGGVWKTHAAGTGHDDLVVAMMIALRMVDEAPLPREERGVEPIDLLGRQRG